MAHLTLVRPSMPTPDPEPEPPATAAVIPTQLLRLAA